MKWLLFVNLCRIISKWLSSLKSMKAFPCTPEKLFLKACHWFFYIRTGHFPQLRHTSWLLRCKLAVFSSVHFNKLPLVLTEITEHMGLGLEFNFGQHCKVNNCQSEDDQCSVLTGSRFIILTKTCPKREQQLISQSGILPLADEMISSKACFTPENASTYTHIVTSHLHDGLLVAVSRVIQNRYFAKSIGNYCHKLTFISHKV